ncbi:helix-turn-helix transcriptional regulator [Streptomyces sp. NBC_00885]|uniref:helix-turn-helix domain-containing protein n=1 Tax=Streptomyces sp. NBC_00885 TaxID=2975857 RepID=UPI00386BD429|nr:helix-turn-helix transcriptional regulator [Streptomyces sp. NBC_00885]
MSPRQLFADELKSARQLYVSGLGGPLSQTELARKARTSKSTISRLENTAGPIPPELPALFDQIFKTDGRFKRLYEETAAQSFPELYRRRMAFERAAVSVWEWSPTIVPGLLQTGGYARTLLRAGDPRASEQEIAAQVGARLARQDILRGSAPPDVRAVLCESVIKRRIAPADVMRDQLAALLAYGEGRTTRIQVLPLDAEAHLLIDGPTSFLTGPNHVTMVCVEAYRTASIIEDPEHVRKAARAYDDLTGEALSARDSADLIRDQMETL